MQGTNEVRRFKSVRDFVESSGLKKGFVADRWTISRFQMTALVYPGRYPVSLSDEQVHLIATDLNQPFEYIRKIYPSAA